MKQLIQKLNGIPDRRSTGEGAKIFGAIPFHLPGQDKPRKIFLNRSFQKRIALAILQHRVIFGVVFLDQIALQHQGF